MPFEARYVIGSQMVLVILFVLLAAAGVFVGGFVGSMPHPEPIVGGAWTILGLGAAAILLRRRLDTGVRVRIDADGIYAKHYSPATIPWSQVTRIWKILARRQPVLRFELAAPSDYPPGGPLARLACAMERSGGLGPLGINPHSLDRSFDELVAAVRRYRPDLLTASP